jgi:hypothetical protein
MDLHAGVVEAPVCNTRQEDGKGIDMSEVPFVPLISPILSWLEKIVSWASWLRAPAVEMVESSTKYGWLGSPEGPPTLLLTVKLRNEKEKPIVIRYLQLKYGNSRLQPKNYQGDRIHLLYRHKQHEPRSVLPQHVIGLDPNNNILKAPFVPPSTIVERFALFDLPITGTELPHHVDVIAKIKFSNLRSRCLALSLSNA